MYQINELVGHGGGVPGESGLLWVWADQVAFCMSGEQPKVQVQLEAQLRLKTVALHQVLPQ